jgi:hypothetical protein
MVCILGNRHGHIPIIMFPYVSVLMRHNHIYFQQKNCTISFFWISQPRSHESICDHNLLGIVMPKQEAVQEYITVVHELTPYLCWEVVFWGHFNCSGRWKYRARRKWWSSLFCTLFCLCSHVSNYLFAYFGILHWAWILFTSKCMFMQMYVIYKYFIWWKLILT